MSARSSLLKQSFLAVFVVLNSFVLVSWSTPVAAQFGTKVARLRVTYERKGPVPTAADARVAGVMSGELGEEIRSSKFYVFGLKPGDRRLCARLQNVDGSYMADLEADLVGIGSPTDGVEINFGQRVRYPKIAIGSKAAEFAIFARVAEGQSDCGDDGDPLVASWQPAAPKLISLSILGDGGTAALFSGSAIIKQCASIADITPIHQQQTAFDQVCQAVVPACGTRVSYTVRRAFRGRSLAPVALRFRAPC